MGIEIHAFRTSELGNSAHVIIDRASGSAVVIDPARDIGEYLKLTDSEGVKMEWALETHVHNDFVSGARELVAARDARHGASNNAGLKYPYEPLRDGDLIEVGSLLLRVLATPGHTPEHIAYLLLDTNGEPTALFSGGTLMVGTAARTDLFGPALSWQFAHNLERSLKEKILPLPDEVVVYPTHGGGSFCAVGAGSAPSTTIGAERATNPLAQCVSSRQFVARSLAGGTYPSYYARMRSLNQVGAPLIGPHTLMPPALGLAEFDSWVAQGAIVVDIRPAAAFRNSHIPASVAVGVDGNLSGWVGWLFPPERPLVLIADAGESGLIQIKEATQQLARIGYDRVVGFLDGGIGTWTMVGRDTTSNETTNATELAKHLDAEELLVVIDVREAAEWHASHIPGSVNVPVHQIPTTALDLPREVQLAVHCGHHYRATLGGSLLERSGYRNLTIVEDGWVGWTSLQEPM